MRSDARGFHLACCAAYSLLCLAWSVRVGPQFLWDFLHYHLYVGHAWAESRLPAELFAADAQSYLNPLAHLPFYAVWQATENSLLGTIWMALLHSLNLWCLHFIATLLIPPHSRLNRSLVVVAVLLGALSPGFLFELGSSYADIIVSIPAMMALWALLAWRNDGGGHSGRWLYLAGFSAGISVGLKPSSLIFCAALGGTVLVAVWGTRVWGTVGRLLASGFLGVVTTGGSHAWMLWEAFRSPVFPLFNGFFLSPWFHPFSFNSERFLVTSVSDFLLFPFHMVDSSRRAGFESMTVDIRPAWTILLVVAVLMTGWVIRLRGKQMVRQVLVGHAESFFWGFMLCFVPLWIFTTGNIRYAIPALMLLGPAIALLALKLGRRSALVALLAVLLPLAGQSAPAVGLNTPNILGYHSQSWGKPWFDLKIPPPLDVQPAYYLSLQSQSFASLAPLFPAASRFYNLLGATAAGPEGLVFAQVREDRARLGLPFRTLYEVGPHSGTGSPVEESHARQDALLSDFGYRVDRNDCHLIKNLEPAFLLVSCGVLQAPPLETVVREHRQAVDERFSRWEQKCPKVFAASGIASIQRLDSRSRFYPGTDFQLLARQDGRLFALDLFNTCRPAILLEDRDGTAVVSDCPVRIPFSSEAGPDSPGNCGG